MPFNSTAGAVAANSYASVSAADAFHTDRANSTWGDAATDEKQVALVKATDYIDASYVFRSVKATDEQALECPRWEEVSVNPNVIKATALLALHMLTDNPNVKVAQDPVVSESSELEGVGSKSVTYDRARSLDPYPFVTKMLAKVASRRAGGASTMRLSL